MARTPEGRLVAEAKAAELAAMTWDELDAYGERVENVTAASGRTFRVKSFAFWDMDEWESGINIVVKAYAPSGLRRLWGYKAWKTRGGPDDLVPHRPRS
jgi:hypothetical protein